MYHFFQIILFFAELYPKIGYAEYCQIMCSC